MPKPTGDGAALLKAICDSPEEDTPRLVYADWLDEQGGESNIARAEFIRLQVAEEAKGEPYLNERTRTPREEELFRKWHTPQHWLAELPEYPGVSCSVYHYERGFPYHVYAKSVRSFLKATPDLYSRVPATWLRISTITARTAIELAKSPVLERISYLDQLNGIADVDLQGLATSPHLGGLKKIVLGDGPTMVGLEPFLLNASLTRLKEFRPYNGWRIGPRIVATLLASPAASQFVNLNLDSTGLTETVATELVTLMRLPKLLRLNIGGNRFNDEVGVQLASAKPANPLSLNLGYNGFTDRAGEAFLAGALFHSPGVRAGFHGNSFSDEMKAKLKEAFGDRVSV